MRKGPRTGQRGSLREMLTVAGQLEKQQMLAGSPGGGKGGIDMALRYWCGCAQMPHWEPARRTDSHPWVPGLHPYFYLYSRTIADFN